MTSILGFLVLAFAGVGFPAQPGLKPVPPKQAYRWVAPNADVVAHVDAKTILLGIPQIMKKLGAEPELSRPTGIGRMFQRTQRRMQMMYRQLNSRFGIDLTKDVRFLTVSMKMGYRRGRRGPFRRKRPQVLAVLGGTWNNAKIAKIVRALRVRTAPQKVQGWTLYRKYTSSRELFFVTPNQQIGFGSVSVVMPMIRAKSNVASFASSVPQGVPGQLMALHIREPGQLVKDLRIRAKRTGLVPLLRGARAMHMSLGEKFSQLHVATRDAAMTKRYKSLLSGFGALAVAGQQAGFGVLHLADAVLEANPNSGHRLPLLAVYKDLLVRILRKRFHARLGRFQVATRASEVVLMMKDVNTGGMLALFGSGAALMLNARKVSSHVRSRPYYRQKTSAHKMVIRRSAKAKTVSTTSSNDGFGPTESAAP